MNSEAPASSGGLDRPGIRPELHRLALLAGERGMAELERTLVIVFGLGGVGSWAAEALVRSGVGRITIVDNDTVCVTNINRQVQALPGTVGLPKAAALLKRLKEISPRCEVTAFNQLFSRQTAPFFGIEKAHYVIDAIDSLTHKLDLIETAAGVRDGSPVLYSSMGMAARLDPARIKTADIWDTSGCPLARLVRQGLRKRGFNGHFTAVYSDEPPRPGALPPEAAAGVGISCGAGGRFQDGRLQGGRCFCTRKDTEWCSSKKVINGSAVTVTAAAGMVLAGLVIQDVLRG